MARNTLTIPATIAALLLLVNGIFHPEPILAAKPSESVLPASTKFSLSIANQQEFNKRIATTQLGKLLRDPAMQPFLVDLPRQLREKATSNPLGALWIDLGIASDDYENLTNGQVTWALIHPQGERPSRLFLADVTGRSEQAQTLLRKVEAAMLKNKARKSMSDVEGTNLISFEIPVSNTLINRKVLFFQKDNLLVVADSESAVQQILVNLNIDSSETLGQQPAYQAVINTCQKRTVEQPPSVIIYLKPLDLADALQALSSEPDKHTAKALLVARKHNFDAIQAVGSFISIDEGDYDYYLRTFVYAPKPWENGMRICSLPNQKLVLPTWVDASCHSVTMLNFDFTNFAKYFGPLFDDVYGDGEEGLYDDLKETFAEDPDGPKVDIDTELFQVLTPQTNLLAYDKLPVTSDSPQRLIAYSTSDEKALSATVEKSLAWDPSTEASEVDSHKVFLSYPQSTDDDFGIAAAQLSKLRSPSFVTSVANKQLMFGTDIAILEKGLSATSTTPMASDSDYIRVAAHLKGLGDETCLQHFTRLRDAIQVPYELFQECKMPDGGRTYQGLISSIALGELPEVEIPQLDGSKLPDFEMVEQYFGLAGLVGISTDEGWYLEGFLLKK